MEREPPAGIKDPLVLTLGAPRRVRPLLISGGLIMFGLLDSLFERVEQVCHQSQIVAAYFFRNPNNAPAPAAPAEGR